MSREAPQLSACVYSKLYSIVCLYLKKQFLENITMVTCLCRWHLVFATARTSEHCDTLTFSPHSQSYEIRRVGRPQLCTSLQDLQQC